MTNYLFQSFIVVLFIFMMACEEDSLRDAFVSFELKTINEQGLPSTSFQKGENIVFSFAIINHTDSMLYLRNHCFYTDDFFKVYRVSDLDGEGDGNRVFVGKPYEGEIGCNKIHYLPIPAHDSVRFEMPWIDKKEYELQYINGGYKVANNRFLQPGEYETEFTQSFQFKNFSTEENTFSTSFTVAE